MDLPPPTPDIPAVICQINQNISPKNLNFPRPILNEEMFIELRELINDWLLLDKELLMKEEGQHLALQITKKAFALKNLSDNNTIFLFLFSEENSLTNLKAMKKKLSDILEPIDTALRVVDYFKSALRPKFQKAMSILEGLYKEIAPLLNIYDEQRPCIIAMIPTLAQENSLESLDQLARCFPSGLEVSNSLLKQMAHLYKNDPDSELASIIIKIHLRSIEYPSLKQYLLAEPEINKKEERDAALAAFLSYDGMQDNELHDFILKALKVQNDIPIDVDEKVFDKKLEQAVLEKDIAFINKACAANFRAKRSHYKILDQIAYACNSRNFWKQWEKNAKSFSLSQVELDSALHLAAQKQNDYAIASLLRSGADLFAKDESGQHSLEILGTYPNRECLMVLLQHKYKGVRPNLDAHITKAAGTAIDLGDVPLLELMASFNSAGFTEGEKSIFEKEIDTLLKHKNTAAIVALHKIGYYCREDGETVLGLVVEKTKQYPYIMDGMFESLIKAGADPYQKSKTKDISILDVVLKQGRDDLWRLIRRYQYAKDQRTLGSSAAQTIKKNKNLWLYNDSLLLKSVQNQNLELLHVVLEQKLDTVDSQAADGKTALHWAVQAGNRIMVRALLRAGIDTTIKDSDGNDAYTLALLMGRGKIAELLSDASK